jgi:hypothetical protein
MMGTMTTQTASRSTRTARSSVPLDPALRALRCEVARWALAAGQPLNLDAIGVILGARHAEAIVEGRPFNRWTTNTVLTFLFGTAEDWCLRQHVTMPPHLGESLLTYVNFLAAAGVLAPGSSSVRQLQNTISDLAGLTATGHRRPSRVDDGAPTPTPLRR